MDGGIQEVVGRHQLCQFHSLGKFFPCLFKESVDLVVHLCGIGAGCLEEHTRDTVVPVRRTTVSITFLSQFDCGDIF